MAKLTSIFNPSGSIDNITTYRHRSRTNLQQKVSRTKTLSELTPIQFAALVKTVGLTIFGTRWKNVIKIGFKGYTKSMSQVNAFVKFNQSFFDGQQLLYENLIISKGSVNPVTVPRSSIGAIPNGFVFRWGYNYNSYNSFPTDKLSLFIISQKEKDTGNPTYSPLFYQNIATRSNGSKQIILPPNFTDEYVLTYSFFQNKNETRISDSRYHLAYINTA